MGVSRAGISSARRRPAADRLSGDPVPAAGLPGAASARRGRHQADGQSHSERRYREPHPAALRWQRARRDPAFSRPRRRHRPRARRLAVSLRSGHERAPCPGAVGRRGFRGRGRQQPQRDRPRRARRYGAARPVADPGRRQAAADRDSSVKICPVCATQYRDDVRFCPNDGQTLRSSGPTHDLVGQVLADRYHIMKKLGEGGMGQVYLAEHVKMGRRSAIKVMTPAMGHDPDGVKVVDFGLAKAVGGDEGGQKVTRTGLVIGTPEFMSPEQLSGDKLDGRSDIYSLGLVLFNMLTGTLPFPADSVQESMVKRLTDEPAELIEVRPDLHFPPGLQQTLDTALARSPVDRYQSAAKFAHDLAAVVGLSRSDAGTALPFTLADADDKTELIEPVRARRRKRSRVPMGGGAIVALGAAGAVVTIGRSVRQTSSVPPADTARQIVAPRPADTVVSRAPVAPPPRREPVKRPPATPARPRIDVARARDLLDDLLIKLNPLNAAMVRDSATHIFYAPGIGSTDKAHAAFVMGNAFLQQFNRPRGCEWLETAVRLDSANGTYRDLARQCRT